MTMRLWITLDVEEDQHCNFPSLKGGKPPVGRSIERKLRDVGELLSRRGARATLFVVGEIVDRYRGVLSELSREGHEIACHSWEHRFVADMTPEEFREDTRRAKERLEDRVGVAVRGYRAPSWSVRDGMPWFYDVLEGLGFSYSSSVFPIRNYLYGIDGAPRFPYFPQRDGRRSGVIEIPVPVFQLGRQRIPFAGGFYFRALPALLSERLHGDFSREYGASMLYLHPGELGGERTFEPPGWVDRLVHGYGTRSALAKTGALLERAQAVSVDDYIGASERHAAAN